MIAMESELAHLAHQLECFASIAQREGAVERAALLLGAAEALRQQVHAAMRGNQREEYLALVSALRARLDARAFTAAWTAGRALDMEGAICYAVAAAREANPAGEG